MPYINSASIQSGQIIQANHVLNVINTFNDTATTDIKMKGTASFNEVNIANLRVTGTASIDVFVTTYYSSSIIYASGSTKFGDSADDTHQYTGSLGVTGTLRVGQGITGSLLGVASSATSASFAATASFVATASFAATASYALNAGVFTGSFATTGSNTFRGAQLFTGSIRLVGDQTITGSLTVSGSSTFTNVGPTVLVGSLVARGGDNVAYLSADRSINTTINTTNVATTASFNASPFANNIYDPMAPSFDVNSAIDVFYSGVSGSGETQAAGGSVFAGGGAQSISFGASLDLGNEGLEPITLSPTRTIASYKLFVYNYGVTGTGWYVKTGLSSNTLQTGTTVGLSGNTNTSLGANLISAGFTFSATNPTGSANTITYASQSISTSATSSVAMNAPVTVTGSLLVTQNITGNLIGSASSAVSSSFATTASFALNAGITIFTGSFATTGSNRFVGNQAISGSVDVTGSLVVRGNTGINVPSPSARLHISGTIRNDSSTGTPSVGASGGGSPSQFYGSVGTEYLSTPPTWLKVNIDGTDYFIAAYL